MKLDFIVYDLEIKKSILKKGEDRIPGIEYCNGWDDHANMGISVLCALDQRSGQYHFFDDKNHGHFFDLCEGRKCIGFNNLMFDDKVIGESWRPLSRSLEVVDLLNIIWCSLNLDPFIFDYNTHGGLSLDALCEANLGLKKSGNGAWAPVLWQQGRYAELYSYCQRDVFLTSKLIEVWFEKGGLIDPRTKRLIRMKY